MVTASCASFSRMVWLIAAGIFLSNAAAFGDFVPLVNINPDTQIVGIYPQPGQYLGGPEAHGYGMVGWVFYLKQPVTIRQVGWYDQGQNGLASTVLVGLWQDVNGSFRPSDNPPQLLGNGAGRTIPAGTGTALNGVWRVVTLANPITLDAGHSYELGALDTPQNTDTILYAQIRDAGTNDPVLTGGRVTIGTFFYSGDLISHQFTWGPTNQFDLAFGIELGPMLFIEVPEPSTAVIAALTVVVLYLPHGIRRKR